MRDVEIPDLGFFEGIEAIVSSGDISFIDTNFFIPPLPDKDRGKDINEGILYYFQDIYGDKEKFQLMKRLFKEYDHEYLKKLCDLLQGYSNITTIEPVIMECEYIKHKFLQRSRRIKGGFKNKEYKGYGRRKAIKGRDKSGIVNVALRALTDMLKRRANGMGHALDIISKRHIHLKNGKPSLGKQNVYDSIFGIVKKISEKEKIDAHKSYADQHLIANAFYLSLVGGTHINVLTFDRHIPHLSFKSLNSILRIYGNKYGRPNISTHRVGYIKGRYGINTKNY